jgi:hypothetical protein
MGRSRGRWVAFAFAASLVACTSTLDRAQVSPGSVGRPSRSVPASTSSAPEVASLYLQPFFFPSPGWHVLDFGRVHDGAPSVAWASTVPFDRRDPPLRTGFPWRTIDQLRPNGIVISVMTTPWYFPDQGPWPKGSWATPDLSTAGVRGPEAEEPVRSISVYEVDGPYALTRVYFGARFPSDRAVERAQGELNRLQLPPACPEPSGKGPLLSTFSARSGASGSVVHVGGTMPFQGESGAYLVGTEVIDVWWGPPELMTRWEELPWTESPPYSDLPVGVVFLGEGGRDTCSFDIAWTVPDVAPGAHRVQVMQVTENRQGMAGWGSIDFRVTS